jgi:protein involved in polysaccharide export with SLBB domain
MRVSPLKILLFAVPMASVLAQTTAFKMNVVYVCQPPYSLKFLSCAGTKPNDLCDVQSFTNGQPFQRGKSTYQQVMTLLPKCHLQTPAEAQADARSAAAPVPNPANQNGPGPGGFKVGDTVRVLIDGWQEAKVTQVHGRSYVVHLPNGIDVSKLWPMEVRRVGKLTPEDHAVGQYDLHDRVQVLVNGKWMDGEIRGQNLNMYAIKVPGVDTGFGSDTVDTTPENIRMSTTAAPPPPAQRGAGQTPKAGLVSCAGKYEGRWEHVSGMAGMKVVFRSGKATITEGLGGEMLFDCFTGEGKVVFYKAGSFTPFDYDFDINNDGTLQTPLGAIKKMGN